MEGTTENRIVKVALGDLKPDADNVRTHDDRNIEAIAESLRRFGQQKPVVITADNRIVAGNGTYAAAQSLGWTELSAVRTKLTGTQLRAYAIADNRTADLADWDEPALKAVLDAIQAEDADLLVAAGFVEADLDRLASDDPDPSDAAEPTVAEAYQVVIDCDDETQQKAIYDRLTQEGLKCRLLML